MTWGSHTAIGVGYAFVSGHTEPLAFSALVAGSILPDVVDRFISMGNQKLWEQVHRKLSHWWLLYVVLLFFIMSGEGTLVYSLYFLFIGALLHIFADMLTRSGVPFLNPFRAGYGLKLFSTGSFTEVVGIVTFLFVLILLNFIPLPLWIPLTAVYLTAMAVTSFKNGGEKKKDKKEIALEELSKIWTGKEINMKTTKESQAKPAKNTQSFIHEDYTKFFEKYVADLPDMSVQVLREIMKILDENGHCPSVVRRGGETNDYPENTFDVLAQIPLWRHSLNVAEEILKIVDNPGAYAAQLLMAAFGHDLGKIDSFDKVLYSMGDHPRISVVALNGIKGFADLPFRTEVEQAILNHHRTGGGELADRLREADRNARKREIGENTRILLSSAKNLENSEFSKSILTNTNNEISIKIKETNSEMERIFVSEPQTKEEKKPKESSELAWLDMKDLLQELKSKINIVKGSRFEAFSMKDGYVYFMTDVFWRVLKKLAREKGQDYILLAETDQKLRRDYIYTLVNLLRDKNFIADGLIQAGYFTAPFTVNYEDGSQITKAYYTPLVSEAFGDVSELESLKTGILLNIISVEPKYSEDK